MSTQVQHFDHTAHHSRIEAPDSKAYYLLDFSAEARCAPCRMLAPALDKLAEEHGDALEIIKIDVDTDPALARRYGIRGIPTLKLVHHGEVLESSTGALNYSRLKEFVGRHLQLE